jgi:hypothetical protein
MAAPSNHRVEKDTADRASSAALQRQRSESYTSNTDASIGSPLGRVPAAIVLLKYGR